MAKFHFTLLMRSPEHQSMLAYLETVESLIWGLEQLGHSTSFELNAIRPDEINVIANLGMLSLAEVRCLPMGSIFLNLEQRVLPVGLDYRAATTRAMDGIEQERWDRLLYTVDHHHFWDYSLANLVGIEAMHPQREHFYLPICWSPTLEKIGHINRKDIEVIFCGSMNENREQFFRDCLYGTVGSAGKRPFFGVTVANSYGDVRDELLARSQIALHAPRSQIDPEIFGIVRCAYLMANRIPVICQEHRKPDEHFVEADIKGAVTFCANHQANEVIGALLEDPCRLSEYTERLYTTIRSRDLIGHLRDIVGKNNFYVKQPLDQ